MGTKKGGPAVTNSIIDDVREAIRKYDLITPRSIVVAGVSGGPDSVCLLHILYSLKNELEIKIEAVHVNHMLRGEESDSDEKYVEQLCGKLNIPVHIEKRDIKKDAATQGISLEEAGRNIRYETFQKIALQTGAKSICVAHNMNDQAETVLMNVLRGAGLEGLKGMEHRNGNIIRPLLDISRARIEEYCIKKSLKPRTDSSNLETQYTRNKIRLKLIPYIKELLDTEPEPALNRMASLLASDNEFLEKYAGDAYGSVLVEDTGSMLTLDTRAIAGLHEAVSSRVIRKSIFGISGSLKGIGQKHIAAVMELSKEGRTGAVISLPQGVRVRKSYDTIQFFLKDTPRNTPSIDIKLVIPGETAIPEYSITVHTYILENRGTTDKVSAGRDSFIQYFDYNAAEKGISIRNRRDGDRIKPLGFGGTKKLKDYFIDKKIPRPERDGILLLAEDNDIIWIIGHETGDKHKVTANTEKVLAVEVKPKGDKPA